jgi:hypothetical protein
MPLTDEQITTRRHMASETLAAMLDKQTRLQTKFARGEDGVDVEMAFSAIADVIGHWLSGDTDEDAIKMLDKLRAGIVVSRARWRKTAPEV